MINKKKYYTEVIKVFLSSAHTHTYTHVCTHIYARVRAKIKYT